MVNVLNTLTNCCARQSRNFSKYCALSSSCRSCDSIIEIPYNGNEDIRSHEMYQWLSTRWNTCFIVCSSQFFNFVLIYSNKEGRRKKEVSNRYRNKTKVDKERRAKHSTLWAFHLVHQKAIPEIMEIFSKNSAKSTLSCSEVAYSLSAVIRVGTSVVKRNRRIGTGGTNERGNSLSTPYIRVSGGLSHLDPVSPPLYFSR